MIQLTLLSNTRAIENPIITSLAAEELIQPPQNQGDPDNEKFIYANLFPRQQITAKNMMEINFKNNKAGKGVTQKMMMLISTTNPEIGVMTTDCP